MVVVALLSVDLVSVDLVVNCIMLNVGNTFSHRFLIVKSQHNRIELVSRPLVGLDGYVFVHTVVHHDLFQLFRLAPCLILRTEAAVLALVAPLCLNPEDQLVPIVNLGQMELEIVVRLERGVFAKLA